MVVMRSGGRCNVEEPVCEPRPRQELHFTAGQRRGDGDVRGARWRRARPASSQRVPSRRLSHGGWIRRRRPAGRGFGGWRGGGDSAERRGGGVERRHVRPRLERWRRRRGQLSAARRAPQRLLLNAKPTPDSRLPASRQPVWKGKPQREFSLQS